ncbi:MAG: stage II sporulation protein D [Paenibacillaceae bacterium]|nr:stage II sporulation protein D [Paenibacillaceae bacterium]
MRRFAARNPYLALASVWIAAALALTLLVPLLARHPSKPAAAPPPAVVVDSAAAPQAAASTLAVSVYLTNEKRVASVPIEAYVRGVVAAEMPIEFELEALKAQALAARTYIVRRMAAGDRSNMPVKEAWVTDTVTHQAYVTDEQLRKIWPDEETYRRNMEKVNRATSETEGQILLYGGEPIDATFFSTSNGYTENSEDYWSVYIPYLRSVPSPWDRQLSPKFTTTVTMKVADFAAKLGLRASAAAGAAAAGTTVLEQTAGHRIKRLSIAGTRFTGRDVREKLGLASAQFSWKAKNGQVEITSTGYGHGVGMSQWGANGMAKESKTAEQIATYYYTGISIGPDDPFVQRIAGG